MAYLNLSLQAKTARLAQLLAAMDLGSAPMMDFYASPPPASPDVPPTGVLLASLPCSAPFGAISNGIADPEVIASGSGYTSIPAFALAGATGGTGATFQVVMQAASVSVQSPGVGFAVNDLIVLPGPSTNCPQSAVLQVTSVDGAGLVTGVVIQTAGQFINALPTGSIAEYETTGAGQGASFSLDSFGIGSVTALTPGTGYTSAGASGTALFVGGGGTGAAAAASLTPVLTAGPVTTQNAVADGVVGMARVTAGGGLALHIAAPGSGGTDGTYALGTSGGAGSGLVGTFTVAGGSLAALQIENPGTYTVAPTITTSGANLSGASVTAALGSGVVDLDVGVAGSGASVIVNATSIVTGGPVVVTSAYIVEA